MLSGTPTAAQAATRYTYTVTDADGDPERLPFTLTVEADLKPTFGADDEIKAQTVYPGHGHCAPAAARGHGRQPAVALCRDAASSRMG